MNRVNSHNDFGHDDNTMNIVVVIIIIIWTRYSIPREWKNYAMQYKKVQKSTILLLLLLYIMDYGWTQNVCSRGTSPVELSTSPAA